MQHAGKIAEILGFSGIDFIAGPYFESKRKDENGIQIDLAFSRSDNVITLCEMKYSNPPISKDVIPEVEKKLIICSKSFPEKQYKKYWLRKNL